MYTVKTICSVISHSIIQCLYLNTDLAYLKNKAYFICIFALFYLHIQTFFQMSYLTISHPTSCHFHKPHIVTELVLYPSWWP